MFLRLEARPQVSRGMVYFSPLIAVALTLVGGLTLFATLGKDPIQGFVTYFFYPVSDLYGITELLLKATPLMLIGMGLSIGFRASIWNIGAEGQYILGAVFATGVALNFSDEPSTYGWLALPLMLMAGALGGGLWAAIPAYLRTRFRTNEILVTLMLVYVAQFLSSWLIHGPWKDPDGYNFPQTRMFSEDALLGMLVEGSRLNTAFLLALSTLVVGYLFLQRSFRGFQMRVGGQSTAAARYVGYSANQAIWIGLVAGGAMAGIAGMSEVAGPAGQLTEFISSNYGFAGIIVAFVGRLRPLGVFLASLLMALLYLGGEQAQQYLNLPSSISNVFQGMLLFFLLGTDLFSTYRLRFGRLAH